MSSSKNFLENFINKNVKLLLFLILVLAFLLRIVHFDGSVTFGYDQARDAFQALDIFKGDHIKLLGPQTDFQGLHHGTLYWYLISPIYFFSNGNVNTVRIFLIILNVLTIFFIYGLTNSLFKDKKISLLSSLFFAISFEETQYARWLSNPAPAIISSTISFWALKRLLDGKKWSLLVLLASWAASVQFEIFMIYQILVFVAIWLFIKGLKFPKLTKKEYLFSLSSFIVAFSPLVLSELKFKFQGIKALALFLSQSASPRGSFTNAIWTYIDRMVNVFYLNLWGINLVIAGIICTLTLLLAYRETKFKKHSTEIVFLIVWIISPVFLHLFRGTNGQFQTLGAGVGLAILTAYLLVTFSENLRTKWLLPLSLILIVLGNLNLILTYNKNGEVLFTSQDKLLLRDELASIDWIYKQSSGQPFRLNTVTNPSLINTTWAYLFNWYGRKNYGYMPVWWGEPQVNVFGSDVQFGKDEPTQLHFLVIEPDAGHSTGIVTAVRHLEDTRSEVQEAKDFGNFIVEKRKITKPDRIFNNQDIFYYLLIESRKI